MTDLLSSAGIVRIDIRKNTEYNSNNSSNNNNNTMDIGNKNIGEVDAEQGEPLLLSSNNSNKLTSSGSSSSTTELPPPTPKTAQQIATQDGLKLLFGAGGIYAAFLYYGTLQEDVFNFMTEDGNSFKQAWFLQVLEAAANVVVGFIGLHVAGGTKNIPKKFFAISGTTQVCAKAFTSLSLAYGLSFPVATLAKSGKMAPVMAGQLLLGGANYNLREYLQVAAIIAGTATLSMGKKGNSNMSTPTGLFFILLSLLMDGITAGVQKRLKRDLGEHGVKPKPYDFMFWTNLYMMIVAFIISILLSEFHTGLTFCLEHRTVLVYIIKFSLCSAIGQSFIFYTVATFDPLVCSTVTTTRKIFSVLLSIFTRNHKVTMEGWCGILLAFGGIMSEIISKVRPQIKKDPTAKTNM